MHPSSAPAPLRPRTSARPRARRLASLVAVGIALAFVVAAPIACWDPVCRYVQTIYLGNHPKEANPGWHEDAQGLTADQEFWYVTQESPDRLWRIPLTTELGANVSCGAGGVLCQRLEDVPELVDGHFDHYGDPDYFEHAGQGYVFVPLEGAGDPGSTAFPPRPPIPAPPAAVVAFRTPNLELAGLAEIHLPGDVNERHGPYVAFDSAGYLYVSEDSSPSTADVLDPRGMFKWKVDWDRLNAGEGLFLLERWEVTLYGTSPGTVCNVSVFAPSFCISTGEGGTTGELVELGLNTSQGADFSDDDSLLYIANGPGDSACKYFALPDPEDPSAWVTATGCGVHVFTVSLTDDDAPCSSADGDCQALRIDRSRNGTGPFNFQYNPGLVYNAEEPEGLTWFDLDAPGLPPIPGATGTSCTDPDTGEVFDHCPVSGQLHVVLLDNDRTNADDVYVKHYRVERDCTGSAAGVRVEPSMHDFGDVPVGGVSTATFTVINGGSGALEVLQIELASADPAYRIASAPQVPLTLEPGGSAALEVAFAPDLAGAATAVLEVSTDDPAHALLQVPLSGVAVGFAQQAGDLLATYDDAMDAGLLAGDGPGNSGDGRAGALRSMLEAAVAMVEDGRFADACAKLRNVYDRIDGAHPPPDFAAGPAAAEIAAEVAALRARLQCD